MNQDKESQQGGVIILLLLIVLAVGAAYYFFGLKIPIIDKLRGIEVEKSVEEPEEVVVPTTEPAFEAIPEPATTPAEVNNDALDELDSLMNSVEDQETVDDLLNEL